MQVRAQSVRKGNTIINKAGTESRVLRRELNHLTGQVLLVLEGKGVVSYDPEDRIKIID